MTPPRCVSARLFLLLGGAALAAFCSLAALCGLLSGASLSAAAPGGAGGFGASGRLRGPASGRPRRSRPRSRLGLERRRRRLGHLGVVLGGRRLGVALARASLILSFAGASRARPCAVPGSSPSAISESPCARCGCRTTCSTCAARSGRACCAATCSSGNCAACSPRRRGWRLCVRLHGPCSYPDSVGVKGSGLLVAQVRLPTPSFPLDRTFRAPDQGPRGWIDSQSRVRGR